MIQSLLPPIIGIKEGFNLGVDGTEAILLKVLWNEELASIGIKDGSNLGVPGFEGGSIVVKGTFVFH